MNPIAEEMLGYFGIADGTSKYSKETLMHYGMPRRSGRYPWGSGEDPYPVSYTHLRAHET